MITTASIYRFFYTNQAVDLSARGCFLGDRAANLTRTDDR
jgi:hypothetical protein